jgi:hypothetical protein
MDKLDRLVTDHLVKRLFEPERLTEILSSLAGRRAQKEQPECPDLIPLTRGRRCRRQAEAAV